MAHPITPNHMKSPDAGAAAINAFYGSTVIDRFGVLDPARAEKQVNAKVGSAVFRKNGPLDRGITDPKWAPDELAIAMGLTVS